MSDKAKKIWDKIRGIRHIEIIIAVIAVIVMLFVYFGSSSSCSADEETGITGDGTEYDYCTRVVNELEQKLSQIAGVGETTVLVSWKSSTMPDTDDRGDAENVYPEPEGVIIICEGGNDIAVKLKLISSVAAYFGIDENKINVLAKGN